MSWNQINSNGYIRKYQIATVLGNIDFSRSLFLVYLMSLGFTGQQTGWLQAILFWTSFLIELPSGVFADKYGRKSSVLIGLGSLALTFLLLSQLTTISWAIGAFVLWGTGYAFLSGANSAMIYDGLKEAGQQDLHLGIMSRTRSLSTFSIAGAILLSGFFYKWNPVLMFWLSAACATLGLFIFARIPEPKNLIEKTQNSVTKQLKNFLATQKGRNLVLFICAMGCIELVHTPFFVFSQILFKSSGLSEQGISLILGFGFLASAFAQFGAPLFRELKLVWLISVSVLILIAGLVGIWFSESLGLRIVLFLVVNSLPMLLFVFTDQYIQDHCESEIRASLLSVHSFFSAIFIGMGYVYLGFFSDLWGMTGAMVALTLPLLVGLILAFCHFSFGEGKLYEDAEIA